MELPDLYKAKEAVERAIQAAKAHEWLMQYAPVNSHVQDRSCTVKVEQFNGSAVNGSAEGHIYLQRAAKDLLEKIGDNALRMASDDLTAAREAMAKLGES